MLKDISNGIKAYTLALELLSKLKLWKYFIIPVIISIVTFTFIFISAYAFSDNIGNWITQIWPWDWGKHTFSNLSNWFAGAIVIVIGVISYKQIILAVSAPFMSPVSEKIEHYLIGDNTTHQHRNTSFQEQLIRGIRINIRNLFKELFLSILIIIGGFIVPFIGNAISTGLLFIIQAYYAGFGNIDYTLERHFKYKESVQFVKQNRGIAIGNGIIFMLFLLIPVVGVIIVLPLSVTAAAIETVKLLEVNPEFKSHGFHPKKIENS